MSWPTHGTSGSQKTARLAGPRQLRQPLASARGHLRAGRASFLFGVAVVLPRATGLLTVPIYTRLLGPADFGRYELLTSVIALAYAGCLLGLDFAISVRFFGRTEPERRRDAASAVAASGAASLVASSVLLGLSGVLGPLALQTSSGALPFAIVVAAVPFNVLGGVLAMYLRLRFQGLAFFRAIVGGAIGGTASGIVLVVAAHWGLVGATVGLATVHVITFILLAVSVRGLLDPPSADSKTALQLVRLGAPLVPSGAATWVFSVADRFFVSAFLGFTQLGLYAAAARLGTILALIQFGFHAAWGPVALNWVSITDRDRRYAASLRLVAIAGGAAVAVVSWLARPLLLLVAGSAYVGASDVVWLLAASVLFSAMFFVVQIGANLAQRGDRVAWATIIAAIVNTVANLTMIPALGYLGAGIATLMAYAAAYIIMYAMSQTVTPIRMGFAGATAWAIGWTVVAASSVATPPSVRPLADIVVVATAMVVGLRVVAQTATIIAPASGTPEGNAQVNGTPPT